MIVHRDAAAVVQDVVARLIAVLSVRQAAASPVHISVTGGGMGQALWPALLEQPGVDAVDWTGVHVWFSDERFVPSGHQERNDGAVLRVASGLGLPVANVHSVPGPEGGSLDSAAAAYAADLAAWAPPGAAIAAPVFAVSVLGVGPDGHVASLFPHCAVDESATAVAVDNSPKPPPQRVSFTRSVLRHCDQLWFLAVGAAKADAVRRALAGDDPSRTPAAGLAGQHATLWFVDEELVASLESRVEPVERGLGSSKPAVIRTTRTVP